MLYVMYVALMDTERAEGHWRDFKAEVGVLLSISPLFFPPHCMATSDRAKGLGKCCGLPNWSLKMNLACFIGFSRKILHLVRMICNTVKILTTYRANLIKIRSGSVHCTPKSQDTSL